MLTFGQRVKLLLKRKHYTQKDVSIIYPETFSENKISNLCLNKQQPKTNDIVALAELFEITTDELLGLDPKFDKELIYDINFYDLYKMEFKDFKRLLLADFVKYNDEYYTIENIDIMNKTLWAKEMCTDEESIVTLTFSEYNINWTIA